MQITNFSFLFLFLPLALLLAFLTRKHLRAQNAALLALSLAFYACSGLRGLSVLLALSFAVWLLARLRGRGWQTLGIRGLHCGALLFQVYRLSDRQLEPADRPERRDPDDRRAARRLVFHVPRHQLSGGRPAGHDPGGAELWLSAALFHVLPQGRAGSADAL